MSTLYVVTSGEYSSYGIEAIFDDKALAQAWMGARRDCEIEEYELNPAAKQIRDGTPTFTVSIRQDGTVTHVTSEFGPGPLIEFRRLRDIVVKGTVHETWDRWDLDVRLHAKSEEQAVKAANEVRAQLVASNEWPQPFMVSAYDHAQPPISETHDGLPDDVSFAPKPASPFGPPLGCRILNP